MSLFDVIGLVVVAMLVAFLCRRHEERIYRRPPEGSDTSRYFDATSARTRLARVRRDYLAVVCARSRDRRRHHRLHVEACRSVRRRSYFRRSTGLVAREADVRQGSG